MALVQHVRHNAPRPLVRRSSPLTAVDLTGRTPLRVVEQRRRAMHLVVVSALIVCALMVGAAWFQTQLAHRQRELDRLDRQVRVEADRNDALLAARSELLAPSKLINRVQELGMVPGTKSRTLRVDSETLAYVQVFTPQPSQQAAAGAFSEEESGAVKAAVGANP